MRKLHLVTYLALLPTLNSPLYSHDITAIHDMCKKSVDYRGCFIHNRQSINKYDFSGKLKNTYGPITIKWNNVRVKNDSFVVAASNLRGQRLYIALNCLRYMINSTGKEYTWKEWVTPKSEFENNMLTDFCTNLKTNNPSQVDI